MDPSKHDGGRLTTVYADNVDSSAGWADETVPGRRDLLARLAHSR